ncbi:MAG TPA: hypothetical protein PK620_04885 [Denitromonas sp.]|uniref:hypothetical protein n=1 Tax=Denitromonas sp. TaxID=2734609 RepID=UPI001D73FA7E|nr:hypothetical protein [Rhodocyclaceae bacterium]MCP5220312.1 hypothetical protein [Zoogloeaceae bacterium]HQU88057.1 hypothetical protein [Denitromonas sp.]HQV14231.1 hypothetical protein [Denitromonas sp.]
MARINLSIPDDLKESMDNLKDVNWSEVAREAFQTTVTIHSLRSSNMEQAGIERLRASKNSNEERQRAEGVKAGKDYALNHAEYDQLEAICEAIVRDGVTTSTPADQLRSLFNDPESRLPLLFDLFEAGDESDAFLEGFIEGCNEIYSQI